MSYRNNIPTPYQKFSSSQKQLLENFQRIDDAFSADHVSLNSENQGSHDKITFSVLPADQSTAALEVGMYAKASTLTGLTELFYRRESDGDIIEFTSETAVDSITYTSLPCGLLIQTGACEAFVPASSSKTYSFRVDAGVVPFTTVYGVNISTEEEIDFDIGNIILTAVTNTTFTVYNSNTENVFIFFYAYGV